jgi:hypothetical protein
MPLWGSGRSGSGDERACGIVNNSPHYMHFNISFTFLVSDQWTRVPSAKNSETRRGHRQCDSKRETHAGNKFAIDLQRAVFFVLLTEFSWLLGGVDETGVGERDEVAGLAAALALLRPQGVREEQVRRRDAHVGPGGHLAVGGLHHFAAVALPRAREQNRGRPEVGPAVQRAV